MAVRRGFPWPKVPVVHCRADRGRVRGLGGGVPHLPRGVRGLRWRRSANAGPCRAPRASSPPIRSRSCPSSEGLVDQIVGTALLMAGVLALSDQRNAWTAGLAAAAADRRPGGGHRGGVRLQRRLRDQPGAGFRAAPVHRGGGLGWCRLHGGQRLVVGAHRRPDDRRASSARCSTTCASGASCRRAEWSGEPLRPCPRPGHHIQPQHRLRSRRARGGDGTAGVPAAVPGPRPCGARPGSHLVVAAPDRTHRPDQREDCRLRPGRDRRHQSARDDHPLGEGDRQAHRQRHRLAEPRDRADLRSAESRRPRGDLPPQDRPGARRLFLRHQDQAPARLVRRPAGSSGAGRGAVRHRRHLPASGA